MSILKRARAGVHAARDLYRKLESVQLALGRIETKLAAAFPPASLADSEFKVFSQSGEDGIMQYLAARVPLERKIFVEFGVETYEESNTRFLLESCGWSGLVLDGSEEFVARIKASQLYWKYNLKAQQAFVTREKIDGLIRDAGITGDIGLLSVDIDGNDYWVWERIECVSPRIVICEYNSSWGPTRKLTIPYDPKFFRTAAHHSNLYFGASLAALHELARRKGYELVGSNRVGSNAFFVRRDVLGTLKPVTPEQAYVATGVRESRDPEGRLTFLDGKDRLLAIAEKPLVDLSTGKTSSVRDLLL